MTRWQEIRHNIDTEKERVHKALRNLELNSIELAWVFADVSRKNLFIKWGYKTRSQWIEEEISNRRDPFRYFMTKAWAYQLMRMGEVFYDHREIVEMLIESRQKTLTDMVHYAMEIARGQYTLAQILDHIGNHTPLPETIFDAKTDPESEMPRSGEVYVRKADVDNFHVTLLMYAVVNGHKTINDALNGLVLSEYPSLLELLGSTMFDRYRYFIENQKFFCATCNEIPMQPTLHHMYPVSLGQGHGPLALLCWSPCHETIVQPQWEKFLVKWTNRSVLDWKKEIDAYIALGQPAIKIPDEQVVTGVGKWPIRT